MKMSIGVGKLDFYYIKIETTHLNSIMKILVPTDYRFKLNFVILVRINI